MQMSRSQISLKDFLLSLKPGEDVLVEYSSTSLHLVFHEFLNALAELKRPFMILDELDQLHVLRIHLSTMGADTFLIDNAKVVKMGGIIDTGMVIGKVDLTKEPPVRKKHYEAILSKMGEEKKFRLVVGFEKALASFENDPREKERIFGYLVRPYLGNPERITVYFFNRDLISERTLSEVREYCTRVLQLTLEDGTLALIVGKSIYPNQYGVKIGLLSF